MKELVVVLLNTTSFLLNQIAQQRATASTKIWILSLEGKLLSQEPNILDTLEGG